MIYRILADIVMVIHLAFVLFVVFGGLLVLRWRRLVWFHFPAFVWGVVIELTGWICPLTPLENYLRHRGGEAGYETGFIDHYIVPVLYPEGMTRSDQLILGALILLINIAVYSWLVRRWRKHE
ncbi:MAG: DUF2784 domain-containing protein [Geobacter sp.]|nr:DUF2784 domain-containing protein [Geobacter sp.]